MRRHLVLWLLLVLAGFGAYALMAAPGGPHALQTFDPDRVADLEVDMWQAYYRHENLRLLRGLITLLHEQYGYSWGQAGLTGFYLARAARTFADARAAYDRVLPDLQHAYARIRAWTHSGFDPAAVSRAELAWWVARRDEATRSPENVGRLIAHENALIFAVPEARVLNASVLRARAGRLRDDGGERADWTTVAALLHQSWRELHAAVN